MRFTRKSSLLQLAITFFAVFVLLSCSDDNPTSITYTPPDPYNTSNADTSWTTDDGLTIYIIEQGYGVYEVIPRDQIEVRYTGRTEDGEVFESTYQNNLSTPRFIQNLTPLPVQNVRGQTSSPLIEGFRRGLLGMVEGEKRTIVVPPSLGYGDSQRGRNNLSDETLYFDVELVEIVD